MVAGIADVSRKKALLANIWLCSEIAGVVIEAADPFVRVKTMGAVALTEMLPKFSGEELLGCNTTLPEPGL